MQQTARGWLARIAFHAAGARRRSTAASTWIALARDARRRGEHEEATELETRAMHTLTQDDPVITKALGLLDPE